MKLRLVPKSSRPLGPLSRAEKLVSAVAWLRSRNNYIMDRGARKPAWGVPHDLPVESPLMKAIMQADRRRK